MPFLCLGIHHRQSSTYLYVWKRYNHDDWPYNFDHHRHYDIYSVHQLCQWQLFGHVSNIKY